MGVYRRETEWDLEVYETDGAISRRSVGLDFTLTEVYEGVLEAPGT